MGEGRPLLYLCCCVCFEMVELIDGVPTCVLVVQISVQNRYLIYFTCFEYIVSINDTGRVDGVNLVRD